LRWADELRTLKVRTNADTPEDARKAREFGAEGIGLCRTEHMFMGAHRQPLMRAMILATGREERRSRLAVLAGYQKADFEELFEAMRGLPVTIRLLDPPLHEFLPDPGELPEGPQRDHARSMQEVNPMLGLRGCRLGILYPEIYEMQVEAIASAFNAVAETWQERPELEIMIPLVGYERELEITSELVVRTAAKHDLRHPQDFRIGTMVELPRACFQADRIAEHADFFSFGTNDLTQTALGFSRDDIEAKILDAYIDGKVLNRSPFETIDGPGVGQMLRMGAWLGRKTNAEIELGVCGEHAGDADSIDFFHHSGIDYVSCSPYRVPIARIAAAQAAVRAANARRS
ncbi:MAG: pyruvate, orthophosphate dikinase, partial [Solirubrobacteraceae bacterium]